MSNVEIVKYIYEKFTRGDSESILTTFAPDVEFRLAEGHPYQPSGRPWFGKDAIVQHFFTKAGPEWDWSIALANVHDLGDPWWWRAGIRPSTSRQAGRSMLRHATYGSSKTGRSRASTNTPTRLRYRT